MRKKRIQGDVATRLKPSGCTILMVMELATCDEKAKLGMGRGSEWDGGEMGEEKGRYNCITLE